MKCNLRQRGSTEEMISRSEHYIVSIFTSSSEGINEHTWFINWNAFIYIANVTSNGL